MDCPICRSNLRTGEKKQVINRINNYDNNIFRNNSVNIINRESNNNYLRNNVENIERYILDNRSQTTNNIRKEENNYFIIFICIALFVIGILFGDKNN